MHENHIEQWLIESMQMQGFKYILPKELDPDTGTLRENYSSVIILSHLQEAIARLNPDLSANCIQQAINEINRVSSQGELIYVNQLFHKYLVEGVDVTYTKQGHEHHQKAKLIDEFNTENNNWCITNQLSIVENGNHKIPDVIIYLNGIPIIVFELKNAVKENASLKEAFSQLQTYHTKIPSLFYYNCLEVISDGLEAKVGSINAPSSRFMSWKTKDGKSTASHKESELFVMMQGMLQKDAILDLIFNFIVFERSSIIHPETGVTTVSLAKKVAGYHQYYAVKNAIQSTVVASGEDGNKKGGVVWHTQGSGKSLSMVFYSGLLVKTLNNPTILVVTDRNDLDGQLFETFSNCSQLLRQTPIQIESRLALVKELKNRQSGGIFFTTIQKFFPEDGAKSFGLLSDRRNIIVLADEAHRTQYGFEAKTRSIKDEFGKEIDKEIAYGFAKHMHDALPNATFLGFTGTPVESTDRNTKAVFGDYIDIYDIQRAVLDGATVPIYYENRFIKLNLKKFFTDELESKLSKAAEDIPEYIVKRAVENVTRLDSIVGHPERLQIIANDIINHYENREVIGKALIVAMSRPIAVKLYNQIVLIRPDWHDEDDSKGSIKVIMSGSSSDDQDLQKHIRSLDKRKAISNRLKDEKDPLKIVIVIDMWLTGFDAPVLTTMYLDKDMQGHDLMQAIARVNRVFKDKPGGLIVDYVPVTGNLKAALKTYTDSKGKGEITMDIGATASVVMLEKYEIVCQMFHGFPYKNYLHSDVGSMLNAILEAEEHILSLENGKERYLRESTALSKAYSLAKNEPEAAEISVDVSFFSAVRARLVKFDINITGQRRAEFETTIKSLAEQAIAAEGVINLLEQSGLDRPDVSIFSEAFMEEIRNMKQKNVAIELLKKLLSDQIKVRFGKNIVKNRTFTERLLDAVNRYNLKSITALEMMELLFEIKNDIVKESERGKDLGLTETEKAFYDALSVNKSAVEMMGDEKLLEIVKELVARVKRSTTSDWTIRQSAKDRVKLEVKRVLKQFKYPPDDEPRAIETVLEQAELHASDLV